MPIQYDRSLYTRINAETQAEVDRVNAEANQWMPNDEDEGEWGLQTTLRKKMAFLERWKANHPDLAPEGAQEDTDESPREARLGRQFKPGETWSCRCGATHKLDPYVCAHWDMELGHTCSSCGAQHFFKAGTVTGRRDPKS